MTKRIFQLPDELVNIIAAGEVVERPASAIKEMLENSIDSGADNIVVKVKEGGVKEISVVDNGAGIDIKDAKLVLERNATSKINAKEDLESLYTYGFRGEALASISSIATSTRIDSSTSTSGFELTKLEKAIEIKVSKDRKKGTHIKVTELFERVPARKKFLKSPDTELKHIKDTFIYSAIPHIENHFELYSDERLIYRLPKVKDIYYRIYEIFGKSIASNLLQNSGGINSIKIKGYIGKPSLGKKNTKYQYIFINNRYIKSPLIHSAISQAYSGRMHREFKPVYFIFIDLDPKEFDINVHPRKLEVKFSNEQQIYKSVFNFTQSTLKSNEDKLLTESFVNDINMNDKIIPSFLRDEPKEKHGYAQKSINKTAASRANNSIKNSIRFSKAVLNTEESTEPKVKTNMPFADSFHENNAPEQVLNSFICVKHSAEIILIDQELASIEIFEKKLSHNDLKRNTINNPILVDLGSEKDKDKVLKSTAALTKRAIEVKDFGGQTIQVLSKPDILPKKKIKEFIKKIAICKEINENEVDKLIVECSKFSYGEPLTNDEMLLITSSLNKLSSSTFAKLNTVSIKSIIKKY